MATATTEKWWEGRIVGYDTETTGTDVHTDRIVTASIVFTAPGQRPRSIEWILDPGIEIPDEAAQVHGWTNDRVLQRVGEPGMAVRVTTDDHGRTHDMPMHADGALFELAGHLAGAIHRGEPLVIANAAYDATITDTELLRHGIDPIHVRPTGWRGVVDPIVLEKQWDPYRKVCWKENAAGEKCDVTDADAKVHVCGGCNGKRSKHDCGGCGTTDRRLESLCAHYGIVLSAAHSSTADALAAVRLAKKLASLWPEIARLRLSTLHQHQVKWRWEQQVSLREFFLKVGAGDKAAEMCPEWPLHTRCVPGVAAAGVAS